MRRSGARQRGAQSGRVPARPSVGRGAPAPSPSTPALRRPRHGGRGCGRAVSRPKGRGFFVGCRQPRRWAACRRPMGRRLAWRPAPPTSALPPWPPAVGAVSRCPHAALPWVSYYKHGHLIRWPFDIDRCRCNKTLPAAGRHEGKGVKRCVSPPASRPKGASAPRKI